MGVNVVYAPVLDLATNPANPALGIRSFGDDPAAVARLAAALVRGLQPAGVAAASKHFPGLGDVGERHAPRAARVVDGAARAARGRGAGAVPGGDRGRRPARRCRRTSRCRRSPAIATLPATLSRAVMTGPAARRARVRRPDDHRRARHGGARPGRRRRRIDVVAAIRAGVDLLLCAADPRGAARIEAALVRRGERGPVRPRRAARRRGARRRAAGVARRSAGPAPDLDVVGCAGAPGARRASWPTRSITLVRDDDGLAAAPPAPRTATILAVMPAPPDLTPADTSSTVAPALAAAPARPPSRRGRARRRPRRRRRDDRGRARAGRDGRRPSSSSGRSTRHRQPGPGRAGRRARWRRARPTVTVALRTPWDLGAYPAAVTHVATYSILPGHAGRARRGRCSGASPFPGRLPVAVPPCAVGPMTPRATRSTSSPRSRPGSSRPPATSIESPRAIGARATSTTSSSPRAARPTTPRSTRSTCSGSGTG